MRYRERGERETVRERGEYNTIERTRILPKCSLTHWRMESLITAATGVPNQSISWYVKVVIYTYNRTAFVL